MDQLPTSAQCQDVGFILWAGGFISSTARLFCLLMNTKTSDLLNPDSRGFISGKNCFTPSNIHRFKNDTENQPPWKKPEIRSSWLKVPKFHISQKMCQKRG